MLVSVFVKAVINFILVAALLSGMGHSARNVSREGAAAFTQCRSKEGITDDELVSIQQKNIPTTPNGKCFLACMMEKSKLMRNNKYDTKAAIKMVNTAFANNQRQKTTATNKIKACDNQTRQITDRCELAAAIATCMKT